MRLILPNLVDIIIFTIQFTLGLLVYWIFAQLFFVPRLRLLPRERALMVLCAPQAFRYLGLYALTQAAYNPEISQVWANSTAYGDLATHVAAVIALIALYRKWSIAIPFVWLCHILGLYAFADSTYKIFSTHLPVHLLNAGWFLPVFYVPVLVWSHYFSIRVLLERPGRQSLTAAAR
jgi:hypothetical protein